MRTDFRVRLAYHRAPALVLAMLLVVVAVITASVQTAHAASCVVDNNGDASAANAATGCLTSGGAVTLRSAIEHFNSVGGTNTITFSIPNGSQITLTGALALANPQNLTITGGTTPGSIVIDGNNATGIFTVASGATLSFSGLTLQHGSAGTGGAIDNSGTLVISNSSLSNNKTTANGGAIENRIGSITMTDSTIANNVATGSNLLGAGIRSFGAATINLTRVTVSGNQVVGTGSSGGGVEIASAGTYNFVNVTISGNSATTSGGGLLLGNGAHVNATNLTLTNNTAAAGAGIQTDDTSGASVVNTIVSGNSPDNCAGAGAVTSTGHNLELGNSCAFSQASDIHADPLLGALASNPPGFLQTQSLPANSPAVDKADATACPATDERGVQRKLDGSCDIGAFEFVAAAVAPSPTPSPTPALPRAGVAVTPPGPWLEVGFGLLLAGSGLLAAVGLRRRTVR